MIQIICFAVSTHCLTAKMTRWSSIFRSHRLLWNQMPQGELILCGHTHGGIVRLPFLGGVAGTNFALFPEYDAGLFETGAYKLYISRGLGNSVPLPRFLNTPELVSITLKCA